MRFFFSGYRPLVHRRTTTSVLLRMSKAPYFMSFSASFELIDLVQRKSIHKDGSKANIRNHLS